MYSFVLLYLGRCRYGERGGRCIRSVCVSLVTVSHTAMHTLDKRRASCGSMMRISVRWVRWSISIVDFTKVCRYCSFVAALVCEINLIRFSKTRCFVRCSFFHFGTQCLKWRTMFKCPFQASSAFDARHFCKCKYVVCDVSLSLLSAIFYRPLSSMFTTTLLPVSKLVQSLLPALSTIALVMLWVIHTPIYSIRIYGDL